MAIMAISIFPDACNRSVDCKAQAPIIGRYHPQSGCSQEACRQGMAILHQEPRSHPHQGHSDQRQNLHEKWAGVLPGNGNDSGISPLSKNIGFASSPTVLSIRADPSTIAEKFIPMNRKTMSCAISGTSYGTMCDALNICSVVSRVTCAGEHNEPWHTWGFVRKPRFLPESR